MGHLPGRAPETQTAGPDRRQCTRCGRVKPLASFYQLPCRSRKRAGQCRPSSWCRTCVRVGVMEWQQSAEYRAWLAAYRARPDVRARMREIDRRRQRDTRRVAARKKPRAKLLHCRRQARLKLRRTADPGRRAALERLIAGYEAELRRMARRGV